MTEEFDFDPYLGALREDLPSAADESRIRRQLVGAGIAVALTLATPAAKAGAATVAKAGWSASLALRFAQLPLLSQFGLVVATTTAVATGPVVLALRLQDASLAAESVKVETRRAVPTPTALHTPSAALPATARVELATAPTKTAAPGAPKAAVRLDAAPSGQELADASALAEETRLIDAALSAIRRDEWSVATQLLDEHRTRFPQARLAREQQRAQQKLDDARNGRRP